MERFKLQKTDGGRKEAGYKGSTGDCVVRAIAIAFSLPYSQVYDELFERQKKFLATRRSKKYDKAKKRGASPRNGVFKDVYEPYIKELGGEWVACTKFGQGCTMHLNAEELTVGQNNCIVRLSRHITCVKDGYIHDTYNPDRGGNRQVYGYWKV